MTLSPRKRRTRDQFDRLASEGDHWVERDSYHRDEDLRYSRFLVNPGLRVLDLGCGNGQLLAALEPSRGVGVDFSPAMVERARQEHPHLEFVLGDVEDPDTLDQVDGPFDVILLSDTVGSLDDVHKTLASLRPLCHADTRVVVAYYSRLWAPVLRAVQHSSGHVPLDEQNWLAVQDLAGILTLTDFEVVRLDVRQVLPRRAGGLGPVLNRYVGTLPGVWKLALRTYVVARPAWRDRVPDPSVTVVIPCRNEAGNIADAVERIPDFCEDLEILFVEGHSSDGTADAVERVIADNPKLDIKLIRQSGKGKGDAVRAGFDAARGEVLMILDADLTTPPEDLPKFYDAIVTGRGELVMGTRLVYPMEDDAMRFLNEAGNRAFSFLFTWLLNQRITDTLCGTKVLRSRHYEMIKAGRSYFGDFDPFGDFDLIFGAAKLNLRIIEIPVRYRARTYGTTQISRIRHGLLLLRMTLVAWRRLKAV